MDHKLSVRQRIGYALMRAGQKVALQPGLGGSVMPVDQQVVLGPNRFGGQLWRLDTLIEGYKNPKGIHVPIGLYYGTNDVVVEGKNSIWDTFFGAATPVSQVDPWYIGLINQSPTPTLSENDTLASHAGWSELTAYTGNRKAWDDADSAAKIKGTTTTSDFTFNASGNAYGILIASVDTGTGGVLWATGGFDASVPFVNTDVLRVTYSVRM